MNATCPRRLAALMLLASSWGCGNFSLPGGGDSVSRSSGELTVTIGGRPVAEGSGHVVTEKRPAAPFRKLAAEQGVEVLIDDAAGDSFTVEADDNLLPLVETKVENETLRVRVTGSLTTRNPIRVTAASPDLSEAAASSDASVAAAKASGDVVRLTADSSGEVTVDEVQGDEIELAANSSGHVTAKRLDGQKLRVAVSSAGHITAAGKVDRQQVAASSSGQYEGGELASRTASVDLSSAGSALVQAAEEITGVVSSAGRVLYVGDPAKISVETSSAGSVTKTDR